MEQGGKPLGGGLSARHDSLDPWTIGPMPSRLIDSPLDFIFAEHHRQCEAATILDMVADGKFETRGLAALIDFLECDFALHVGDEECVLFPVLRLHCMPADDVDRIIDRFKDEHRTDELVGEAVLGILNRRLNGQRLSPEASRQLRAFAEHIREHLMLENSVLLPIARARLKPDVLRTLADMLRVRRRAKAPQSSNQRRGSSR